jgi:hypothetical protein
VLAPLGVGELGERLGRRLLVELVDVGGVLGAVVVRGGGSRAQLVTLGPMAQVADEVAALRFSLGRLLVPTRRPASADASAASADASAERLDELLLGPVRRQLDPGDGAVIVPTGVLHGLPWGVLPSLHGVAVSVAPSARAWLTADQRHDEHRHNDTIAVLGGPGLPDVDTELAAVAACHRHRKQRVEVRPDVTTTEAMDWLGRSDIAHLAAHGRFRGDSPMFSSLTLADGPLTVHDLERLPSAPRLVVLSACDVGRSDVRPGDEVQGVVSVLLGLGTACLVASVLPVAHHLACDVTVGFHQALAQGQPPAAALALAHPAQPNERSPFVLFGSG